MFFRFSLVILFIFFLGCSGNPKAPPVSVKDLTQIPDYDDLVPDDGLNNFQPTTPFPTIPSVPQPTSFEQELLTQGIQLTSREIQFLNSFESIQFTGQWASTKNLSAQQNLEQNFQRFSPFFKTSTVTLPTSTEMYRLQAVDFANGQSGDFYLDTNFYIKNRQLLVIKWSRVSGEFIVVRSDGTVANYLISRAVKSPRYAKMD